MKIETFWVSPVYWRRYFWYQLEKRFFWMKRFQVVEYVKQMIGK